MAIGTALALGIGSSVVGAVSANKAAKAQTAAANSQIGVQRETRDLVRGDLAPYAGAGVDALGAIMYELGLGPAPVQGATAPQVETYSIPGQPGVNAFGRGGRRDREGDRAGGTPATAATTGYRVGENTFTTMDEAQAYANANKTGGTPYGGFTKSPGYDFQLSEGLNAIDQSAASRGNLFSGETMKAAQQFGTGLAAQDYSNYFNRLMGVSNQGQNAAAGQGQAAQFAASGISNGLSNIGNARAAGAIGVGNAIQNGIGNGVGIWQYQNGLNG